MIGPLLLLLMNGGGLFKRLFDGLLLLLLLLGIGASVLEIPRTGILLLPLGELPWLLLVLTTPPFSMPVCLLVVLPLSLMLLLLLLGWFCEPAF